MWTRDTIERLYQQHAYPLFRRCRQLLRDDEAARDVMHEVFLHALRDPEHFEGRSGAATYLYGVATRLCLKGMVAVGDHLALTTSTGIRILGPDGTVVQGADPLPCGLLTTAPAIRSGPSTVAVAASPYVYVFDTAPQQ